MSFLHGFNTATADFLTHQQVGTANDAYGDSEPVYDWVTELSGVSVRYQSGARVGQGYEASEIGAIETAEPKVFAEPDDVGHLDDNVYVIDIDVNDRVVVDAPDVKNETFRILQVNAQALDRRKPEIVEFKLEQLEDGE